MGAIMPPLSNSVISPVPESRARRVSAPSSIDDSSRSTQTRDWGSILSALVVVASCLTVLAALHPELLIRSTTAAGGDMGAHVWFPAYLRDHLLGQFRVAGWAPDWFAGFPAGQFYFPLPALTVVFLDIAMPYNVAFKLVSVLGVVMMPAAAYAFGRGLRAPRPTPTLFSLATVLFLFFKGASGTGPNIQTIAFNQGIMGGTLRSTLAGEFSFSIAIALALVFLGAFASALNRRTRAWIPVLLLAATVISHIVVAIFAVVAALVIWATAKRPLKSFGLSAAIGGAGALLTAFWTLPLLATFGYTANMRYEKITDYWVYLFPREGSWVGPFPPFAWCLLSLAAIGAISGAVLRRRSTIAITVITVVFGFVFILWPELHAWNLRFLPFWYFGLGLLAACAVGEGVRALAETAPRFIPSQQDAKFVTAVVMSSLLIAISVFTLARAFSTRGFLDFWAEWNYSGYEDTRAEATRAKAWPEFEALINEMNSLPAGRAVWEGGGSLDNYGTPLALELLPYFTKGRIQSVEGLYFESAATTPYHFMGVSPISGPANASNPVRGLDYRNIEDFSLGVRWMQVMGEDYYLAYSDAALAAAAVDQRLTLLATTKDTDGQEPKGWSIYRVSGSRLVEGLSAEPVVTEASSGKQSDCFDREPVEGVRSPKLEAWECMSVGWFNDPSALDRPLVVDGPESWVREADPVVARLMERKGLPKVEVTKLKRSNNSISFHVSRVGVPVIVRESYYPNWRASGADGPYRTTPNFMVMIPTSKDVTLSYARSGPEWIGFLLSLLGIVGIVLIARRWPVLEEPDLMEVYGEIEPAADAPEMYDPFLHGGEEFDDVLALVSALRTAGYSSEASLLSRSRRGPRAEAGVALASALERILRIEGLDPEIRARSEALALIFDGA